MCGNRVMTYASVLAQVYRHVCVNIMNISLCIEYFHIIPVMIKNLLQIDLITLLTLTDIDLQQLGISYGARRKMLAAIAGTFNT